MCASVCVRVCVCLCVCVCVRMRARLCAFLYVREEMTCSFTNLLLVDLHLFFQSHRWEIIITLRKISIVLLGTFGTMQSVEITACISLIVIFVSIIIHLLGKPFGTHSAKAWRLHLLELSALFVVWFIHWGGLMLYLCSVNGKKCINDETSLK